MNNLLSLIASDGFICVNKNLIRKLGLNGAVLLGELVSQYNYWVQNKRVDKDNYFYLTAETCTYNTGLSYYEQSQEIEQLKKMNILSTKNKGMPAKRYFKINADALENLLSTSNSNSKSILKYEEQESKNLDTSFENLELNNNINNNKNNNINNNKSEAYIKSQDDLNSTLIFKNSTQIYRAPEIKKESNLENSKSYKNLVEFISNLKYNQTTIENLLLWYNNVGKGKVSIKQLKDKIIKLHNEHLTEDQINQAFFNAYTNGWFGFYPPNSYGKTKVKQIELDTNILKTVSSEDLLKNEDGSLVVY